MFFTDFVAVIGNRLLFTDVVHSYICWTNSTLPSSTCIVFVLGYRLPTVSSPTSCNLVVGVSCGAHGLRRAQGRNSPFWPENFRLVFFLLFFSLRICCFRCVFLPTIHHTGLSLLSFVSQPSCLFSKRFFSLRSLFRGLSPPAPDLPLRAAFLLLAPFLLHLIFVSFLTFHPSHGLFYSKSALMEWSFLVVCCSFDSECFLPPPFSGDLLLASSLLVFV